MLKPQYDERNEECFLENHYPEEMDKLLSELGGNERLKELAGRMAEIAYKQGYTDAWREALFVTKL